MRTYDYEFVSGETIAVSPIPSWLSEAVTQKFKAQKPVVPTKKVLTDEDTYSDIPNPNEPEYVAKELEYQSKVAEEYNRVILLYCLNFDVGEGRLEKLKNLNDNLAELGLPEIVKTIGTAHELKLEYIDKVLLPDTNTTTAFWTFVMTLGLPREGELEAKKRGF